MLLGAVAYCTMRLTAPKFFQHIYAKIQVSLMRIVSKTKSKKRRSSDHTLFAFNF